MIVCLVTPGTLVADDSADASSLLDRLREAAEAGVDLVQIRERALDGGALFRFTQRAVAAARDARVVVNERVDVAIAAGAAGVHLRGDSMPASRVRTMAPPGFTIGRSVHGEQEARDVEREGGVDYLVFGTVYPSGSKAEGHPAAGVAALRRVTEATTLPVIAIGGMTVERTGEVMGAGAAGLAAIGLFTGTAPLAPIVASLRRFV